MPSQVSFDRRVMNDVKSAPSIVESLPWIFFKLRESLGSNQGAATAGEREAAFGHGRLRST